MRFSKAYLNEKNLEGEQQHYLSELFVIANKIINAAPFTVDPYAAYVDMAKKISSGEIDPTNIFEDKHWNAFKKIEDAHKSGKKVADVINNDKSLHGPILSAYQRLKSFRELEAPEQSTPSDQITGQFDYEGLKEVFTTVKDQLETYLNYLNNIKQRLTESFAHLPQSVQANPNIDQFQKEIEGIYQYLKKELDTVHVSFARGAGGFLDTKPTRPPTTSRIVYKTAAESAPEQEVMSVIKDWELITSETKSIFDQLYKRFFFKTGGKDDIGNKVIDSLQKIKDDKKDKRSELWNKFSDYLASITKNLTENLATPTTGKNTPIKPELLDEAFRVLKWNMVKVIGDFNIAKDNLARITNAKTNPLLQKDAPREDPRQVNVYKIPFNNFYDKYNNNMANVFGHLDTTEQKLQDLISKVSHPEYYSGVLEVLKNTKALINKSYRDLVEVKNRFIKQAAEQDDASVALQQIQQYIAFSGQIITKLEAFINKARTNLYQLDERPDLSPEDGEQVNALISALQDMQNGLREERIRLDNTKKSIDESSKSSYNKIKDWWGKQNGPVADRAKQLYEMISGGVSDAFTKPVSEAFTSEEV